MNIKARDKYVEFTYLPEWTRMVFEGPDTVAMVNARDPHKWSGKNDPPALGEHVIVRTNNIGPGTVTGYFAQYGWLGVLVKLDNPPGWWLAQNPERPLAHIFGIELDPVE
jgi:hypothetical protein